VTVVIGEHSRKNNSNIFKLSVPCNLFGFYSSY